MKFGDGFTGFGPNFIFNCESSEQPVSVPACDGREGNSIRKMAAIAVKLMSLKSSHILI